MNKFRMAGLMMCAVSLASGTACVKSVKKRDVASVPADADSRELIRSDYEVGEIPRLCDAAIAAATTQFDAIARVAPRERTLENTILAFEKAGADLIDAVTPLTFMGYVSTDTRISPEGSACEEKLSQYMVTVLTRKDLYDAVKNARGRNADERRLISETLRGFELNGLKLSADKLARVKELKTRLASLESQFQANLNRDNSTVEFDQTELEGVSSEFLARLSRSEGGKYIVTTKSTDYVQVMENATRSETRRKLAFAYENRQAAANTPLLEEAISLRQQIASTMGFATWADYRTRGRMARDGRTAMDFLNGLKNRLAQRHRADLNRLLAFKKQMDPTASHLDPWDIRYFENQVKKRDYSLDDDRIREYFPADVVVEGMFNVYSRLLGVRYVEVDGASVWHSDVKLYRIENIADNAIIGYFFADFFPRPNKYGHAAAFTLTLGRRLENGQYSKPVSSIVANFNPPAGGKPSLLSHDEVETIFHEFGHIMHQTLTRAPYASLAGSSTAQDFVEAPSQMLENWVWSPEILNMISGHYQDRSRKLPADLLGKMLEARDFNKGYFYMRQLHFGLMDLTFHTARGRVDVTQVHNQTYRDIIGLEPIQDGHFPANFGHLMGGYDAGYYSYLWSDVYAADMFTRFERGGLLNSEVGMSYRRNILERGNMVDGFALLRGFLGRNPNNEAFFRKLHIGR